MMKSFLSLNKGCSCVLGLISRLSTSHNFLMHSRVYTGTLREGLMSVSQEWHVAAVKGHTGEC